MRDWVRWWVKGECTEEISWYGLYLGSGGNLVQRKLPYLIFKWDNNKIQKLKCLKDAVYFGSRWDGRRLSNCPVGKCCTSGRWDKCQPSYSHQLGSWSCYKKPRCEHFHLLTSGMPVQTRQGRSYIHFHSESDHQKHSQLLIILKYFWCISHLNAKWRLVENQNCQNQLNVWIFFDVEQCKFKDFMFVCFVWSLQFYRPWEMINQ